MYTRGFEYLIQIEEPDETAQGIEILDIETEELEFGEYSLEVKELYDLPEDTIWWFRAICYQNEDWKVVGEWMKNVPTVETISLTNQLELNAIPMVIAKGQITDYGANDDITERGFRIIKEYKGDLWCMNFYIGIISGNFKVMEEVEKHTVLGGDTGYEVIGYYWTGKFYRDSVEKNGFELGEYERTLGGGMLKEGFGIYLKQNDTYLIQAIARNNLGTGYGELQEITTMEGTSVNVSDEQIGYNKFEKTVTLGNVPTGLYVTRIGIRLGRTKSCSELHYYKDGSFTTGNSVTFMVELEPNSKYYIMPYIVMDYGGYEEEILGMMSYTDPDMEDEYLANYPVEVTDDIEDEDELGKNAQAGEGNYSYRQIEKEIKCEKIGEQSLIDYYGRRRSYTVSNHLIQTKSLCCVIISDYLDKFQRIKLKVAVDIDMPIPFEEEDTILLGDGKTLFKNDTQGEILFKADGEGELQQNPYILAKIRKVGAMYTSGTEVIIPLELEV